MGSKADNAPSNINSPSRKSTTSLYASQQRSANSAELNSNLGSVLRQLENFSPSSKMARHDENVSPVRSIFSCKLPMGSTVLPRDVSHVQIPGGKYEWEKTPKGQKSSSVTRDDFWEALRSHYNYLMDEGLIASCREASDELTWEEEGKDQTLTWSFTEFIQKFNELHDVLQKLHSDVVAASEASEDKSDTSVRKLVFEKLQLAVYGCKMFKEQASQLGRRYPDMKDEINRRVVILANKWEAVEQAINPHKPILTDGGLFQEATHEMRCLRKWLRELEARLHPLTFCTSWTLDDLEQKYKEQVTLQKEIESRGKFVSSLLKLCDQLDGESAPSTPIAVVPSDLCNDPSTPTPTPSQPWDADRFRKVAANLEKRWHAIWLRSLEWQCLLEELLAKNRSGKTSCDHSSNLDYSASDEPQTKYPRIGNDWDEFPSLGHRKMSHQPLAEAPSPTFSSSSETGQLDSISQSHQGLSTTDRGIMVGTTGIAQLKAECGGSFGRFEIIQDVGYSSESSTQLSNDEKSSDFIRVYSYSPIEKSKTLINKYNLSGDELFDVPTYLETSVNNGTDIAKRYTQLPALVAKEELSTMDWQFTSEDEDFENYPFEDHHPPLRRSPLCHSSPQNRKTLKSELEDCGANIEAWARRQQQSDTEILEVSVLTHCSSNELDTSAVTVVHNDAVNDSAELLNGQVKKLTIKEDSRKRSASATTQLKLDLQKHPVGKLAFGKESTLRSTRVKEWLRGCNQLEGEDQISVEESLDESEEWPVVVVASGGDLICPVGTVVDSSCDASGEYTTNEEDGSNSDSQGDEVNESVAFSRSGTGSVETVVPVGKTPEDGPMVTGTRVLLRSKKRSTRGDRPWSVSELQHLTSQLGLSHLSTSEGALNTLIHSTKLLRGSSPPKSKRSQPNTAQCQSVANYPSQSLPLRRTRRHRSRGSLHLSPTSPYAPSLVGAPGGGPTPSGTSSTNTDSGSDGLSPISGYSQKAVNQQNGVSDSAQYSSSAGGITSTGSLRHSGSSGSKSNRRKSSPSNRSLRRRNSPKTSNLDLSQLKGALPNHRSSKKSNGEPLIDALENPKLLAPHIEDQSSVSDQVWDGYEDPPYLSEQYSEPTADDDQVKRLLNFGDDYRAFIGSHSDTSSSVGGNNERMRSGTLVPISQDLRDDSDSDSDVEELQHIMGESLRALRFAENSMRQYKDTIPSTECAELLATCQTNLKCLQVIAEHLDSGLGLRNFTSDDLFHLQELIGGWEMLQTGVLSSQTNGQQYKDVQLEINDLRSKMSDLALIASTACGPFLTMEDLESRITSLQASLSTLHETKATLLAVNLKVHRLLTDAGLTLSGLKDDVTDLYCQWDDVYEQSGSHLSDLQNVHGTWVRFNQRRKQLLDLLDNEERSESSDQGYTPPSSPDPFRRLAERSRKANEAQELVISLHQDAQALEPHLGGNRNDGLWATVSKELETLGARVNRMQHEVAAACRRQSLGEEQTFIGSQTLNLSHPSLNPLSPSPEPAVMVEPMSSMDILEATLTSEDPEIETSVTPSLTCASTDESKRPKRSRFWRIFRASLPIQMALVLLYCLAWLMEPHCCDAINNMNFSFTPTLRYVKGPPPV